MIPDITHILYSFFLSSFFPFIIFALLFSLPPSRNSNSDPGSHSRLFSPPIHYGSCLAFLSRENFSSFFPRRLAPTTVVRYSQKENQGEQKIENCMEFITVMTPFCDTDKRSSAAGNNSSPRTNAPTCRVHRNWTKSGGSASWPGFSLT